jgi:hypothetical protein
MQEKEYYKASLMKFVPKVESFVREHISIVDAKDEKHNAQKWEMPPITFSHDPYFRFSEYHPDSKYIVICLEWYYLPVMQAMPYYQNFEYPDFNRSPTIGGFFTPDLELVLKMDLVHEVAHALIDFFDLDQNGEDHDTQWKELYYMLRKEFINSHVRIENLCAYGATKYVD